MGSFGFLDSYFSLCESASNYYFGKNLFGREAKKDAAILLLLSYISYIPYGRVGYLATESYLKISKSPLSVAEFRLEKLKRAIGDSISLISDEEMAYVKDFFDNFQKDDIDLYSVMDVASLYCRIHWEIEACHLMEPYIHREWILPRVQAITDEIASLISEGAKTVSASKILDKIQRFQLRVKDLEYLKQQIR